MSASVKLTRLSPATKQIAIFDDRDRCCELTRCTPASGGLMKSNGLNTLREIIDDVSNGRQAFSDAYFAGANSPKPCKNLTDPERQIMTAFLDAATSRDINTSLGIRVKTVENHGTNWMRKLAVQSVATL